MQEFLEHHGVSKHYWPERLELLAEIPRNAVGKIQKFVLRERAAALTPQTGVGMARPLPAPTKILTKIRTRTPMTVEQVASLDGRGSAVDPGTYVRLLAEVTAWVEGPGEDWAQRIEDTGTVPAELRAELKERGFLGLAAPVELGGRGLSFSQWMGLMEVFPARTRPSG